MYWTIKSEEATNFTWEVPPKENSGRWTAIVIFIWNCIFGEVTMEFAELITTPKLDGVILHTQTSEPVDGTLCITGHHLILSSRREGVQELWLLHQCIDVVERKPIVLNNMLQGGLITMKCKDLRIISLEINKAQEYMNVAQSIEQLSNLNSQQYLYPFFYRPMYTILEDGYTMFNIELEFAKLLATDEWRVTHINQDYSVCPTYGAKLVVPKSITDDDIVQSAAFRDGGRFPVLSYRHDNGVSNQSKCMQTNECLRVCL